MTWVCDCIPVVTYLINSTLRQKNVLLLETYPTPKNKTELSEIMVAKYGSN
jgi:hypothetical protein